MDHLGSAKKAWGVAISKLSKKTPFCIMTFSAQHLPRFTAGAIEWNKEARLHVVLRSPRSQKTSEERNRKFHFLLFKGL